MIAWVVENLSVPFYAVLLVKRIRTRFVGLFARPRERDGKAVEGHFHSYLNTTVLPLRLLLLFL